ncbi:MAG: hypothetical protein ACLP5H_31760 [Desulfomonilaceae bacterium]
MRKGDVMDGLQASLDALERARSRKRELKGLIRNLAEQYRLVKEEMEMHKKRAEALIHEHEYVGYLDTTKLDPPRK